METPRFAVEQDTVPYEPEAYEGAYNYEILTDPELRAKYITYTDNLISHLIEDNTDVAIFLDKSARPVAWLVKNLWDTLAPVDPATGQIYRCPAIKFLNIDREQWGPYIGRSEDHVGGINVNRIPESTVDELRATYAPIAGHSKPGDESLLTGKNVMVIDEVRTSGDTLRMADKILQRAFPDANGIKRVYWMPGVARRDASGNLVGGEVPVWYSDRTNEGRLVANRDATKSSRSKSSRQRVGKYWLSARFRQPDVLGRKLKDEVALLARELSSHDIPYMPTDWNENLETLRTKIERVNGISMEEYTQLRRASSNPSNFIQRYSEYIAGKQNR